MAARAFDDPGCDWPALSEGLVVAEELLLVVQVADARVGPGPAAGAQAGGVGLGGDLGGGPGAVVGQHREGLDGDPVLGGGVAGVVEGPGRLPLDRLRGEVPARELVLLLFNNPPPNHAGTFRCTWLSSDLFREDGWLPVVDVAVAGAADHEGLAPHFRHDGRPPGLAWSRPAEAGE